MFSLTLSCGFGGLEEGRPVLRGEDFVCPRKSPAPATSQQDLKACCQNPAILLLLHGSSGMRSPPRQAKKGGWCKLMNRETMDWCHILSWEQIWWWKRRKKKAWALKRAKREAQFRLCSFSQDFTWALLTGDMPFTVWTPGYRRRQCIKYLVHFWFLSDVVSYSTGIRQDGFQMAEEGLALRSPWPQTHRLFIHQDQARGGLSLGMADFKIQTKSQFWHLLWNLR